MLQDNSRLLELMEHGDSMLVAEPAKPICKSKQQSKSEHNWEASSLLQRLTETDGLLVNLGL